jgi:hypothetical protein
MFQDVAQKSADGIDAACTSLSLLLWHANIASQAGFNLVNSTVCTHFCCGASSLPAQTAQRD